MGLGISFLLVLCSAPLLFAFPSGPERLATSLASTGSATLFVGVGIWRGAVPALVHRLGLCRSP